MTISMARDKLIEDVTKVIAFGTTNDARMDDEIAVEVINLIAERLADVTEEMVEAGMAATPLLAFKLVEGWRAMLSASPLNGGKEK